MPERRPLVKLLPAGRVEARYNLSTGCGFKAPGTGAHLAKTDLIDVQGTVTAVHSGGIYRVECGPGHEVLAQLSGRMRRFRIKVVPGDRVTVGVSPYDMTRGFITFRTR